ncbi:GREB1-like protein [Pontoporia blainvillei]|uniref:GREB1-like protein n=1 Tax=Pontoporia blainvillei TaxID=48723 RepID=A0ABX0S5H1_PONBL|nr:GREB1-like protein [Pontoporia blainvillei]
MDSKAESRQTYRAPGQTDGSDLLAVKLRCETSIKELTKLPTCRLYVKKALLQNQGRSPRPQAKGKHWAVEDVVPRSSPIKLASADPLHTFHPRRAYGGLISETELARNQSPDPCLPSFLQVQATEGALSAQGMLGQDLPEHRRGCPTVPSIPIAQGIHHNFCLRQGSWEEAGVAERSRQSQRPRPTSEDQILWNLHSDGEQTAMHRGPGACCKSGEVQSCAQSHGIDHVAPEPHWMGLCGPAKHRMPHRALLSREKSAHLMESTDVLS